MKVASTAFGNSHHTNRANSGLVSLNLFKRKIFPTALTFKTSFAGKNKLYSKS